MLNIRSSIPSDEEWLKQLWAEAFPGDSSESIEKFFKYVYKPGMAKLLLCDGIPVSALYMLTGYTLKIPNEPSKSCGYIYAFATAAQFRSKGYGKTLLCQAAAAAFSDGYDCIGVYPEEESLYPWYEQNCGAKRTFSVCRKEYKSDGAFGDWCTTAPINGAQYNEGRRQLLGSYPHVDFSDELMNWQHEVCLLSNGGMYRLEIDGEIGYAIVEIHGDILKVKELLISSTNEKHAVGKLLKLHPARFAQVTKPAFISSDSMGEIYHSTMCISAGGRPLLDPLHAKLDSAFSIPKNTYWGPVFD